MTKKYWKCKVCGDIHYGNAGPEMCPTCETKNAYEEVDKEKAKETMGM
jgi:rubrerythrin